MESKERFKKAEFAAILGILVNLFLAIVKGIAGFLSGSSALIADAANSASDVGGSSAVYIGLRAAKQPPDEDHPYGHGKAESIAAIIVAVLLGIVGFEIARNSFQLFFEPIEPPKILAIYILILAIIVKEIMFQYNIRLGKRLNSSALIANAYDHRSDVYTSSATLIGVGLSILSEKLGMPFLVYADPLAGLLVAIIIFKLAWTLGKESVHTTLDHVLPNEETEKMRELALKVEGVKAIGQLYAREHGHYVIVDIKISVDPDITVEEGHKIGKEVKRQLMTIHNVNNVLVHVNPYNPDDFK